MSSRDRLADLFMVLCHDLTFCHVLLLIGYGLNDEKHRAGTLEMDGVFNSARKQGRC